MIRRKLFLAELPDYAFRLSIVKLQGRSAHRPCSTERERQIVMSDFLSPASLLLPVRPSLGIGSARLRRMSTVDPNSLRLLRFDHDPYERDSDEEDEYEGDIEPEPDEVLIRVRAAAKPDH